MKKHLPVFFFAILVISTLTAQPEQAYLARVFRSEQGDSLNYRILYPASYDREKHYPLVIFLHGSGERGSDNRAQLVHGAGLFLEAQNRERFPAIVVFPQCPAGDFWSDLELVEGKGVLDFSFSDHPRRPMGLLLGLVDQLLATESIDPERLYAGGLSLGGFGTFDLLARRPGQFAAAFPICGGGSPLLAPLYGGTTSLWIFHGAKDEVVLPENSRAVYRRLKGLGANVRYTEYPEANHNSWDSAFAEPELLPWLFAQRPGLGAGERRYREVLFDSVSVTTHVYATKAGESLALDLYRPGGDVGQQRMTILYVHGGGFAGGRRDSEDIVRFARSMATRGYVVASMSYRLTMRGKSFSCDQPAPNKIRTFQLAVEDIRDATLFLLRRSGDWGIDPQTLVLAGSSAGAEAVLHAAYWSDADLLPSASALPDGFRYGGVISMAGALVDTSLITRDNAIPIQFFHGTCDPLVPYATASHHYCPPGDPGYLLLHGAQSIAEQLARLGLASYLLTECNAGHEWAGLPLLKEVDSIIDFLYHDVYLRENRMIHRWYHKEGSCERGRAPGVCE